MLRNYAFIANKLPDHPRSARNVLNPVQLCRKVYGPRPYRHRCLGGRVFVHFLTGQLSRKWEAFRLAPREKRPADPSRRYLNISQYFRENLRSAAGYGACNRSAERPSPLAACETVAAPQSKLRLTRMRAFSEHGRYC